jgi:outer membrane receptor protein involved in Fe transport
LSGSAGFGAGTEVNFFPGEGKRPFLASAREVEASLTLRPGSRLRVQQGYLYSALSTRDTHASIFTNHIFRSRVTYQFTRALSLRAIVDYERVRPDPVLVDLDDEKHLTGDVLLTWLLHPGTAVYVGYTDRYERFDPFDPAFGGRQSWRLRSTGRQVFVKASYLFRF